MAEQGYNGDLNSGKGCGDHKQISDSGKIVGGGSGEGPTKGGKENRFIGAGDGLVIGGSGPRTKV